MGNLGGTGLRDVPELDTIGCAISLVCTDVLALGCGISWTAVTVPRAPMEGVVCLDIGITAACFEEGTTVTCEEGTTVTWEEGTTLPWEEDAVVILVEDGVEMGAEIVVVE